MYALRYITTFQLILKTWHVILKVFKKHCMSVCFIQWMNFLWVKTDKLLMVISTLLYYYFYSVLLFLF
jgi:hypothetical protein